MQDVRIDIIRALQNGTLQLKEVAAYIGKCDSTCHAMIYTYVNVTDKTANLFRELLRKRGIITENKEMCKNLEHVSMEMTATTMQSISSYISVIEKVTDDNTLTQDEISEAIESGENFYLTAQKLLEKLDTVIKSLKDLQD